MKRRSFFAGAAALPVTTLPTPKPATAMAVVPTTPPRLLIREYQRPWITVMDRECLRRAVSALDGVALPVLPEPMRIEFVEETKKAGT